MDLRYIFGPVEHSGLIHWSWCLDRRDTRPLWIEPNDSFCVKAGNDDIVTVRGWEKVATPIHRFVRFTLCGIFLGSFQEERHFVDNPMPPCTCLQCLFEAPEAETKAWFDAWDYPSKVNEVSNG